MDEHAVIDDDALMIPAGPDSPVQFATTTLMALGLLTGSGRDAYEGVFHRADASAYPALKQVTAAHEA